MNTRSHATDSPARAGTLRALHEASEILVLVNVWDVVSARAVAETDGCRAIATASHSIAEAHGFEDGELIPRDLMLASVARVVAATDLPVTADLESGFGDAEQTLSLAVESGVVGANIEDGLRPLDESSELMRSAMRGARRAGVELVLNARTDTHLAETDWSAKQKNDEAVRRGLAYLEVGATCVFVPGAREEADIRFLSEAFDGRLSVLGFPGMPGPAVLQEWGVARVSYGPGPQCWAMAALAAQAQDLIACRG